MKSPTALNCERSYGRQNMKFIDLFAGIGGFHLGMEQAGHKCVGWVEWDKFARKSYQAIHDVKGVWNASDIRTVRSTEIPRADCWCFGFPCFVSGTKVATQDGLKNIEDITVEDYVLTIDGSFQHVLKTMIKTSNDIYQLKIQGQLDTKVTGNHPYYIRKKTKDGYSDPKWVSVRDVVPGDLAMSYIVNSKKEKTITDEEAWLLGRYVADGYVQNGKRPNRANSYNHKTVFAIGSKKANEFRQHLNHYHATESIQGSVVKFIISNEHLMNLAMSFKRGAANKEMPTWAYGLNPQQRILLIDGAISGDGYLTKSGYTRYSTISKSLAISLQKLIEQTYGVGVSMFKTNPPKKKIIEGRTVNQNPYYTLQFKLNQVNTSYDNYDGAIWYPVSEVKRLNELHDVYNLEVENNHTYTANGIVVHNCQDISVAGKQGGFTSGRRSSLFFTVTGLLRGIQKEDRPAYLLIENVKNILSINNGWDFAKLQVELDEIGYDVEWDVLDSAQVVPQHRERIFIVGHLRGKRTQQVFPIVRKNGETNNPDKAVNQVGNISNSKSFGGNPQVGRVYGIDGISPTLSTMQGGGQEPKVVVREATKSGYDVAQLGDSINFAQPNSKTRRGRVGHGVANTLTTVVEQATLTEDKGDFIKHGTKILSQLWERAKTENYAEWSERVSKLVSTTEILRQIMYEQLLSQDSSEIRKCELVCSPQESQRNRYGYSLQDLWSNQEYRHPSYRRKYSEQFTREFNCFVQKLPHKATQAKAYMQNLWKTSKRIPSLQQALHQMEKIRGSFVSQNQSKWRIRKITPLEAWRLQGFPDWAFDRAKNAGLSDAQLYKQAGNSVTVPVVRLIAERMALANEARR